MIEKINQLSNYNIELNVISYILNNINIVYNLPTFFNSNLFYNQENKKINDVVLITISELNAEYDRKILDINLILKNANKAGINPSTILIIQTNHYDRNFINNIKILKELELKRSLVLLLSTELNKIDVINDVSENFENLHKSILQIENFEIETKIDLKSKISEHKEKLNQKIKLNNAGGQYAVTTGIEPLNKAIIGWMPSELIILGGRPSMGKTAVALQFILNSNVPTLFLSLEMNSNSLIDRMLLRDAENFNSFQLRTGKLQESNLLEINSLYKELMKKEVFIDDFSELNSKKNIEIIEIKIRKYIKKYDIKFVVIDYLSLISHSEINNNIGYGIITKTFKSIAKENDIPIMLLVQLNRNLESRGDKRPVLSDLRDSGEIEQDADIVISVFRQNYYDKLEFSETNNIIELGILKNRQGMLNTVELRHNSTITSIFQSQEIPF